MSVFLPKRCEDLKRSDRKWRVHVWLPYFEGFHTLDSKLWTSTQKKKLVRLWNNSSLIIQAEWGDLVGSSASVVNAVSSSASFKCSLSDCWRACLRSVIDRFGFCCLSLCQNAPGDRKSGIRVDRKQACKPHLQLWAPDCILRLLASRWVFFRFD